MNNLTWHCELILQNDEECSCAVECLTTHVMNRIYHRYDGQPYVDQRGVRICVLAQFLRNYVEELTDSENEFRSYDPMTSELITGALQEVDFKEIAENLIGDYSTKSSEEIAESEEYFEVRFRNYDED